MNIPLKMNKDFEKAMLANNEKYGEDFDLTRRIHRHYKTLFFPMVNVYHKFSRGSYHSLRLFMVHMASMVKYFNKWGWIYDAERRKFNRQILKDIKMANEQD